MQETSTYFRAQNSTTGRNIYTAGFWRQAIQKKFLERFDTSFDIKMVMKIYAIEIIFKYHEPFQSYQLTGPASSARKAG